MERTTSFVFIPTPQPQLSRGLISGEGILPAEYFLARLTNDVYEFDHKFSILTDPSTGSASFQVLTKDASGNFTETLPENRFSIENRFIRIALIDIYSDGSEYKFRLSESTLVTPENHIILKKAKRPVFGITKTKYVSETTLITELNFIGSIDIRAGLTGQVRVVLPPGNEIEISALNGDLIFQY